MPTQSTFGLRTVGVWLWYVVWDVGKKWIDLLLVWTPCDLLGIRHLSEEIVGINLSSGEYTLV